MSNFFVPLVVPYGLKENEITDWFFCSNQVQNQLEEARELDRRRFLKSSVSAGIIGSGCFSLGSAAFPNRADAQFLATATAIITFLDILIPAIKRLTDSLDLRERVPAAAELKAVASTSGSHLDPTVFTVIDRDSRQAETAAAMMAKEGIDSDLVETSFVKQVSPQDWNTDDTAFIDVKQIPVFATIAGKKSLNLYTGVDDKRVGFNAGI